MPTTGAPPAPSAACSTTALDSRLAAGNTSTSPGSAASSSTACSTASRTAFVPAAAPAPANGAVTTRGIALLAQPPPDREIQYGYRRTRCTPLVSQMDVLA